MAEAVPPNLWVLSDAVDLDRRIRLLGDTSPDDLLDRVIAELPPGSIETKWKEACFERGLWRIEARIPLRRDTFDLLYNGRMGYRAQYYLSVASGRKFNDRLVAKLSRFVKEAAGAKLVAPFDGIEMSLKGPDSKIWIAGDWAPLIGLEAELLPQRWVEASIKSRSISGLVAPCPAEPAIDLKGTFIDPTTGRCELPPDKKSRHEKIHETGWT